MKSLQKGSILHIATLIIGAAWIIAQVIVITAFADYPQLSDAGVYSSLAEKCFLAGQWYPSPEYMIADAVHPPYIIYPGVINLYILLLNIFESVKALFWANLLLNIGFGGAVWYIARSLANPQIGNITFILFCLSHVNLLFPAMTLSELPAHALGYGALALMCLNRRWSLMSAGILMTVAIYMRPSVGLLALAAFAYALVRRKRISAYLLTLLPALTTIALIIAFNYQVSRGYVFYTSNTGGINILMGANDNTNGHTAVALPDSLDPKIDRHDVFQCDSMFRSEAMKWISTNPGKWMASTPLKLRAQFETETYFHMSRKDPNPLLARKDFPSRALKVMWLQFPGIYEFLLWALFLIGVWKSRVEIKRRLWPTFIPIAGVIVTCILTAGAHRYNTPMMPVVMFYASIAVGSYFSHGTNSLEIGKIPAEFRT